MKLYTFQIPHDAAQGRLYPLVLRMLPQLPAPVVREAFDRRDVKQNGQRVPKSAPLLPGAEVKLYAAEGAERMPVRVVYQDDDLAIVLKPRGVSCEKDAKGGATITELARESLFGSDAEGRDVYLCHRLDNPTAGLLLLAKNAEAQAAMREAFAKRQIHKHYVCLTRGTPQPPARVLRAYLLKDAQRARVWIVPKERAGAVPIVTEYAVMESGACARLDVTLHTGRTHQIRAHLASIGHPLLGDDLYGDRAFNKQKKAGRLMLYAVSLAFSLEGKWSYLNGMTFTTEPDF